MEDYKYFQLLLTRCNGFCCHMVLAEFRRRDHREGEIMGARMAAGQPSHLRSTVCVYRIRYRYRVQRAASKRLVCPDSVRLRMRSSVLIGSLRGLSVLTPLASHL